MANAQAVPSPPVDGRRVSSSLESGNEGNKEILEHTERIAAWLSLSPTTTFSTLHTATILNNVHIIPKGRGSHSSYKIHILCFQGWYIEAVYYSEAMTPNNVMNNIEIQTLHNGFSYGKRQYLSKGG